MAGPKSPDVLSPLSFQILSNPKAVCPGLLFAAFDVAPGPRKPRRTPPPARRASPRSGTLGRDAGPGHGGTPRRLERVRRLKSSFLAILDKRHFLRISDELSDVSVHPKDVRGFPWLDAVPGRGGQGRLPRGRRRHQPRRRPAPGGRSPTLAAGPPPRPTASRSGSLQGASAVVCRFFRRSPLCVNCSPTAWGKRRPL